MIGAAAAAANLLLEFKIPEKNDEILTKNKNGKVILVNSTARLNFSLFSKKPGAIKYTSFGVKISAKITTNKSVNINKLRTSSANFLLFFLFSDLVDI